MRKLFFFLILLASVIVWAGDVILASSYVPQAILAKQIAPGTSHSITFGGSYVLCDPQKDSDSHIGDCKTPHHFVKSEDIDGAQFHIDFNLFKWTWPKTQNPEGDENWDGHFLGGGLFLNSHYAMAHEVGISPTIVQWIGPFYLGAAYDLSLGHYSSQNLFTGSFNLGGGFMGFMSNHGIGFGTHGGIRQMHFLNVGYKEEYSNTDNKIFNSSTPQYSGKHNIEENIFYYGLDFLIYSNSPLLNESNRKGHYAFLSSFEMGIRTDNNSLMYFAFSFSVLL